MPLLAERPPGEQAFIVLVLPALFGAVCGVLLGISAGIYTVLTLLGILGGIVAGYDHATASEGALRGVADGILGQGFEPTPSYAACSMCDYRIACPAAER